MLIRELKPLQAHTCHELDPAIDCARLMRRENIGFVPVLDDDDEITGVVTDRDLALRLVAADLPWSTPVREVMSAGPLLCVYPEDELRTLEEKMAWERKSRAIVVDHSGNLLGVVSLSDVAKAEPSEKVAAQLFKEVTSRETLLSYGH